MSTYIEFGQIEGLWLDGHFQRGILERRDGLKDDGDKMETITRPALLQTQAHIVRREERGEGGRRNVYLF